MFDFAGGEFIGGGFVWRAIDQFKEEAGKFLKQAIENGVCFHELSMGIEDGYFTISRENYDEPIALLNFFAKAIGDF